MKVPPIRVNGFQHYAELGQEYKIGYEGEKLVYNYLKQQGLDPLWSKTTINSWDIMVNWNTIDVKTVDTNSYKTRLLVPVFQSLKNDYYIGVRLPDQIKGYLSREEVLELPIAGFGYCNAYYCELDELRPIKDLVKKLRSDKH